MFLPAHKATSKCLADREMRTSLILLACASAPIALVLAAHIHWLLFMNWLLLWGVLMLPSIGRRRSYMWVVLLFGLGSLAFVVPVSSEEYFMAAVLLLGVPEQLDKNGHPNPFNLLSVIFPALCVMVLSDNFLIFVLILVSTIFYIGLFILRYNRMPLSGLRVRILPVATILTGMLFVTIVLFLFLPRFETQSFSAFQFDKAGTGLTDVLDMGRFSSVIQNEEIAFRAFMPQFPSHEALYWRVYLLTENIGGEWVRGVASANPLMPVSKLPPNRHYTVRHATGNRVWLPILGAPSVAAPAPQLYTTYGGELIVREQQELGLKTWPIKSVQDVSMDLALPESLDFDGNPRIKEWARAHRVRYESDAAFIDFVMAQFTSTGFRYSLSVRPLSGDKVDRFFFDMRIGYCSHYAIAMTSILRAAGIPANIVVGYSGGSWNEFGNYVVVRQSDAHAWVEAKPDGKEWVRFDPTTLVPFASDMIRNADQYGLSPSPVAFTTEGEDKGLSKRLKKWLRWADNFFIQINNDIVLYDKQSRNNFLSNFDVEKVFSYIILWFSMLLCLLLPLVILRWHFFHDSLMVLDKGFLKLAAQHGFVRSDSEGRLAFSKRFGLYAYDHAQTIYQEIMRFSLQWCRGYFSSHQLDKSELREMKLQLRKIRKSLS